MFTLSKAFVFVSASICTLSFIFIVDFAEAGRKREPSYRPCYAEVEIWPEGVFDRDNKFKIREDSWCRDKGRKWVGPAHGRDGWCRYALQKISQKYPQKKVSQFRVFIKLNNNGNPGIGCNDLNCSAADRGRARDCMVGF